MKSVQKYLEKKLKLKVNQKKSKVDRAQRVKILGFSFFQRKGIFLVRVARETLERIREKLRRMTRRTRQGKLEDILQEINRYVLGWIGYYRLADTLSVLSELDEWLRRRLRQMIWKRWKRGTTRYRELLALGVPRQQAQLGANSGSPWRMAHSPIVPMALSKTYFEQQGLISIGARYQQLRSS